MLRSTRPKKTKADPPVSKAQQAEASKKLKAHFDRLIVPGNWEGRIVGPSSITIGGYQQQVKHKSGAELSSCFLIAFARSPASNTELPFIVTLLTGGKERHVYPGTLHLSDSLMPMLHLFTNRQQFSDLINFADQGRLGPFSFSLSGGEANLNVTSWTIQLSRSATWQRI